MRTRTRAVTLMIAATAILLAASVGAVAGGDVDALPRTGPVQGIEPESQGLAPVSSSKPGNVTTLAAATSPSGCIGKSNNAHKPGVGGVKGVTQIDCDIAVPRLTTEAQLWRRRWWGYQKMGAPASNTNDFDDQVKASALYHTCEENNWRTEGNHWSVEDTGTYYAYTAKYADVQC